MVCIRFSAGFTHLLLILPTFIPAFSYVLDQVTVVATADEFALLGDRNLASKKGNVDAGSRTAEVQISAGYNKTGGRKMAGHEMEKGQPAGTKTNSGSAKTHMKVTALTSVRNRKNYAGGEEWKDNFMAFSADYRSPKPHPPKNN